MCQPQCRRVVVKISGEALMGDQEFGISPDMIRFVAEEVRSIVELGVQIAIVVGGGNIFRGIAASSYGMDRTSADHMGMLATIINSIALQDALEKQGVQTRVQSAIAVHQVAEPYILRRAIRHLEKGRVVIFAAGTGNPYFTTDTAAVLRGQEIHAEMLLKATKVDGLFDADPMIHPNGTAAARMTADPYSNPYPSCRNFTPQIMSRTLVGMKIRAAINPQRRDCGFLKTVVNAVIVILKELCGLSCRDSFGRRMNRIIPRTIPATPMITHNSLHANPLLIAGPIANCPANPPAIPNIWAEPINVAALEPGKYFDTI